MKDKNSVWNKVAFYCGLFVSGIALMSPVAGYGAGYPDKPITVVVGFPPGGPSDLGARLIGEKLSKSLGVPVVIKNQPGAGGIVAAAAVAKAKPDGYTLIWATIGAITSLATRSDLSYTLDDLTPIAKTLSIPGIIAVRADSPFKDFHEFLEFMKKNPRKLKMGSDGAGSSPDLHWTILASQAGVTSIAVPYKGGGPNTAALLGGHVDFSVTVLGPIMSSLEAGKLRALALFSPRRSSFFPAVPTTKELGYPDSARSSWQGYLGPAGLPAAVLAKLEGPIKEAVDDPEVAKTLGKLGMEADYLNAAEFKTFLHSQLDSYKLIAEKFNLRN